MKILIDLQSIQSLNKDRGIGRFSLGFAEAVAAGSRDHQVCFLLNSTLSDNLDLLIHHLSGFTDKNNIHLFKSMPSIATYYHANAWRQQCASLMFQKFIADISPDLFHISSFFDGIYDDSIVCAVNNYSQYLTSMTLYDLIPYSFRREYLTTPEFESLYLQKVAALEKMDLLLGISQHSCDDALKLPFLKDKAIVNISADTERYFQKMDIPETDRLLACKTHRIREKFLLYTGGIDFRKNIGRLLEAYSLLHPTIRVQHQLVIVCSVSDTMREHLLTHALSLGLEKSEVVFTGHISDDSLLTLYNLCELFIFPSLSEGFGLPVLEAMRCGAAVIGSDRSSLPEIINFSEALFNPEDPEEMSQLIEKALTDEDFRRRLRNNSDTQQALFSWSKCAKTALDAFEQAFSNRKSGPVYTGIQKKTLLRLAYISPLPPEKSGIADYSNEILGALSREYRITLVTRLDHLSLATEGLEKCTVDEFKERYHTFDRVLYHFGNSEFHDHMFGLITSYPGVMILHDFYLSGICQFMEAKNPGSSFFKEALYYSHGYKALDFLHREGPEAAIWEFPCNRMVIDHAAGVIVHSQHSKSLVEKWYGPAYLHNWRVVPLPRKIPDGLSKKDARKRLGLRDSDFMVCSVGNLTRTKMNVHLVKAWAQTGLSRLEGARLIFVGSGGGCEKDLKQAISDTGLHDRIIITGFVSLEDYRCYLAAADLAVQLRTTSRGETSISVLDCLSHGLPVIVNAHGAFAELPDSAVCKLNDHFELADLADAIDRLYTDPLARKTLSEQGKLLVSENHSPENSVRLYAEHIENLYAQHPLIRQKRLVRDITGISDGIPDRKDLADCSISISSNYTNVVIRQLFVDISELVRKDAKSGIQRVVHGILRELLKREIPGIRVEPVYKKDGNYFYARNFTLKYLGLEAGLLPDSLIEIRKRDIFLALDLDIEPDLAAEEFLFNNRRNGLEIHTLVYDLIPVSHQHFYPPGAFGVFRHWLDKSARTADHFICISKSVGDDLHNWLESNVPDRLSPVTIDFFHLGTDFKGISLPSVPETKTGEITFLMVGTLEPRKNHVFVIDAMDHLWNMGLDVRLVLIGKSGWLDEVIRERIIRHPQYGKRLIWEEKVTDSGLQKWYQHADALIMASDCEGFGLPIIEAAAFNLAVIARDLPVFREVAGNHAFYFDTKDPVQFAAALDKWLGLYSRGSHPESRGMNINSWGDSCTELLSRIMDSHSYITWTPVDSICETADSRNVYSEVGRKLDGFIMTSGKEGFLLYGPYRRLEPGRYRIQIQGQILVFEKGRACFELTANRSREILCSVPLSTSLEQGLVLDMNFNIHKKYRDVEIRIRVNPYVTAKISGYTVIRQDNS